MLILVLLLVSFISVMFHTGYLISLIHLCFIITVCTYSRIDVSVVTVSNILLSVGFRRFCKKNRGFRFGFCLSLFPPVVNVVRLCGPLHIKHAAVRYIYLCITPVDSSKYQTACDWWRENLHLYPMSSALRNATCLAVCATDIRC